MEILVVLFVAILFGAIISICTPPDKVPWEQLDGTALKVRVDEWKKSVVNPDLEVKLFCAAADYEEEYQDELEEAYREIEAIYKAAISPVYEEYVTNAARRGEDEREHWRREMLIDSHDTLFNERLKTNINKTRILLANRGYFREEDVDKAVWMELGYMDPVEGVLLDWCVKKSNLDSFVHYGKVFHWKTRKDFKGPAEPFRLYLSWPYNGWDFWL